MFSEFADKSVELHQLDAIQPLYKAKFWCEIQSRNQSKSISVTTVLGDFRSH